MANTVETGQLDITADVQEFLTRELNYGEEHTVEVPDLRVVAVEGLIIASRYVQDFDGCHPKEGRESAEAESFEVQRMTVGYAAHRHFVGPRHLREVLTSEGYIPTSEEALANYQFVGAPVERREQTDADIEVRRMLENTRFLAATDAKRLVGHRQDLLASAANPLKYPISVPRTTEYGHAEQLMDTPVEELSIFEDDEGRKQVGLVVRHDFGHSKQIAPVPFNHVSFEVRDSENQRAAILERARSIAVLGLSYGSRATGLQELVREYNQLGDTTGYGMCLRVEGKYPNEGECRGMVATLEGRTIVSLSVPTKEELGEVFSPDRLIVEPATGQLYVADLEANIALSAQHAIVAPEHKVKSLTELNLTHRRKADQGW